MLKKSARQVKGWNLSEFDDYIMLSKSDDIHSMSKFEVYVDDSLGFTVRCFGWTLPETSELYNVFKRSVRFAKLSLLLNSIEINQLCHGVDDIARMVTDLFFFLRTKR